jgi:type I restriction enzyme S subunit
MYPTIKEDFVIRYKIPLAPLPEQHRIVAKIEELFTRLDAGVEALKKIKLQLKRYRQSVLKFALEGKLTADWREAYQGKLEPASVLLEKIKGERKKKGLGKHRELPLVDTSVLPAIPKTWVWTQAEYICDFITKGTTPTAKDLFKGVGDIPFIKVYNLTNYGALDFDLNPTFISFKTHSHELARSKIFPGDVLMNIVGPPLGKVSIVPTLYPEWNTNQAIAIFRPLPGYDRKLLCFSLLTGSILLWAQHRAKATAGQFNLTLEICRALPLPLPPVAEQHEVVEEIERHLFIADEIEMIVEQSLTQSERLRQSIMKKAFEGKLVPQDPNDEPAEKLLERIRQERARQQAEHKPAKSGRNKSNTKQMRLV